MNCLRLSTNTEVIKEDLTTPVMCNYLSLVSIETTSFSYFLARENASTIKWAQKTREEGGNKCQIELLDQTRLFSVFLII